MGHLDTPGSFTRLTINKKKKRVNYITLHAKKKDKKGQRGNEVD